MTSSTAPDAEVAIVGAGPVGVELAVALRRAGIGYVQFDAGQVGHTIGWWAPQTRWFSSVDRIAIAGVPLQTWDQSKATREEYLAYLRRIVLQYDLPIRTYEPVTDITRDPATGRFTLATAPAAGPATCTADHVVLATGGTDHPRKLAVPGEPLPHVHHYFKDPHTYFGKRLLVVGGRNSAVEAALRCHHAGARVSLSYRRGKLDEQSIKYWLLPEINGLTRSGKIGGHFDTVPAEITPTHVRLASTAGKPDAVEPFDFVLVQIGYTADSTLMRKAGIELRAPDQLPTYDERTMQTNVPGLFVAGTAIGGTQEKYHVFLENCHVHVPRILAAIRGETSTATTPEFAMAES